MSRKSILILALAPVLLALTVACGGDKKKTTDSNTPSAQATSAPQGTSRPQATTPSGSTGGADEAKKVTEAFGKVRSYRAKMTIEAQGQKQEGTYEFVAPDRLHITMTIPGAGSIETISIGNDSYTKIGNSWTKSPGAGFGASFDPKQVQSGVNDLSTAGATKSGSDTVEGKKCDVWTLKTAASEVQYCITSDSLPLRVVSSAAGSKVTIIFTDYNANIEIKAPI